MKLFFIGLLSMSLLAGCRSSPKDDFLSAVIANADVRPDNAEVALRCETIVSSNAEGIVVRYRPIEIIKGHIPPDLLDADGLLDLTNEYGTDVAIYTNYHIYLRRTQERTGIYKNAPLKMIYSFTFIADQESGRHK